MSKLISIKMLVVIGISITLIFILNRFLSIPTGVSNTSIFFGMAILAFISAVFGPVVGFLTGFIGNFLVDLTAADPKIWLSWIICSALFGIGVGNFNKLYNIENGGFGIKQAVIFNCIQIVINILVWALIAPTLDNLIYTEPPEKVYLQGLIAAAVNIVVVLVLGSLLAFGYSKTRTRAGSLKAE